MTLFLIIPPKEFENILEERIKTGETLLSNLSKDTIPETNEGFKRWNSSNIELLSNSFNIPVNEYVELYKHHKFFRDILSFLKNSKINQETLTNRIEKKNLHLRMIIDKIKNMKYKQKILFLAANPTDEARLQTDKEYKTIKDRIRGSSNRDSFEFLSPEFGVTVEDLIRVMNQKPEIVHFSGHGSLDGIVIANDQNETQLMPTSAIERLFEQHQENINLVVLNACYSAEQAKVISEFGIYVIGMNVAIEDNAAISFAGGLYIGLGEGKSVEKAFVDAMIVISIKHPESDFIPEVWYNGQKLDL